MYILTRWCFFQATEEFVLEVFYSPHVEMSPGNFVQATLGERVRVRTILGHGGGRQEGGKKRAGRGDSDFFLQGGSAFCSRRGKGYCKIAIKNFKTDTF